MEEGFACSAGIIFTLIPTAFHRAPWGLGRQVRTEVDRVTEDGACVLV